MNENGDNVVLIGYSQHACVVADILASRGRSVNAYCDQQEALSNPLGIEYFGSEDREETRLKLRGRSWFVAIGDNRLRQRITEFLINHGLSGPTSAIHRSAVISSSVSSGAGTMAGGNVCINAHTTIGQGVICNTNSTIEHNCQIGNFSHIGPGAVLTGGVIVGAGCLIGANAVIAPRVIIGSGAIVGAGTVVLCDVPKNATIVGNPGKLI